MTNEQIAMALAEAEATGLSINPIRDYLADAEAAYAVQEINTVRRLNEGQRLIGRKIGLTNPVVQKQLGVDQPDYGALFANMDMPHGSIIPWNEGAQYKVEAELAFILNKDLPNEDCTVAEVMRAIEYVVPCLEIVGSRIGNWDIKFVDTVADNGSSAFFTLGPSPKRLDEVDLLNCKMQMTLDEKIVSEGVGRACLGSPLNALQWLAQVMAKTKSPLREGDVVLSGALGPMVAAIPSAKFVANIEGFGETSIEFGV